MFTGLVEEVGTIKSIEENGGNHRITISAPNTAKELKEGNSVAVNGVCLTALDITPATFCADLAAETWARTSLSRITQGAQVNLELPLKADGRLGGHMVQGHVDGVARFAVGGGGAKGHRSSRRASHRHLCRPPFLHSPFHGPYSCPGQGPHC